MNVGHPLLNSPFRRLTQWLRRTIDSQPHWDRALILWAIFAAIVLNMLFARPFLTGRVPVAEDGGAYFLPVRDFYARCLAKGDSFDWMPQIFCGFDLTGEGQLGGYHPVHWLLYRTLPLDRAYALEMILPQPLLFLGMIFLLRRHMSTVAAVFGALLFTFSVYFLSLSIYPHSSLLISHIPWLLTAIDIAVVTDSRPRRVLACVAIALLTGSQLLLGHPQSFTFSLFIEIAYTGLLIIQRRPSIARLAGIAFAKVLGACVGTVQLLASYEALQQSNRANPAEGFAMIGSCPLWMYLGTIVPPMWWSSPPWWSAHYFGTVPLIMLCGWWALSRRDADPASNTGSTAAMPASTCYSSATGLFWLGLFLAIIAIELTRGGFGFLYPLQVKLPLLGSLRCPDRYTIVAQFGLTLVAAAVFMRLASPQLREHPTPWPKLAIVWVPVLASLIGAIYLDFNFHDLRRPTVVEKWYCGVFLFAAAAAAFTVAARGNRWGLLALVVIAACDSGIYALGNPRMTAYWQKAPRYDEWLTTIGRPPTSHPGRIYSDDWFGNRALLLGQKFTIGYTGMVPTLNLDYHLHNALRVANTAWIYYFGFVKPVIVPGTEEMGGGWWKVPDPLPRARLLTECIVSNQPAEDIDEIDVDRSALVTRPLELTPGEAGSASITVDRPGNIRVAVEAAGRQLFVLSERFHTGWKATVDGAPIAIERVNGDFQGCVVEPGRHEVAFVYDPAYMSLGKTVSLGGLFVCMGLGGSAVFVLLRPRLKARSHVARRPAFLPVERIIRSGQ